MPDPTVEELQTQVTDLTTQVKDITAERDTAMTSVTTLTGERDTAVNGLETATGQITGLQEANKKFSDGAAELASKTEGFTALETEVKTLREGATAHATELSQRDTTLKEVTDKHITMRRNHISQRNGIELSKLTDLTEAQLDAIELTHPVANGNNDGKGMDLSGSGGGHDVTSMTEKDRALQIIDRLKAGRN